MSWDAVNIVRNAAVAKFVGGTFDTNLSTVNASTGTSAPQLALDAKMTSGMAIYTTPRTTYVFPCVEVMPPEGRLTSHSVASTTSEVSMWVFLSFRGSESELDAWSPVYLTALMRTFLSETDQSGYIWSPVEFSASPVGATTEGTFVQTIGVRLLAEIAEIIS